MRARDELYEVDAKGWVRNTSRGGTVTGIRLPRLANRKDVSAIEILDECDVVYQPLQGSGAMPRRFLLKGVVT